MMISSRVSVMSVLRQIGVPRIKRIRPVGRSRDAGGCAIRLDLGGVGVGGRKLRRTHRPDPAVDARKRRELSCGGDAMLLELACARQDASLERADRLVVGAGGALEAAADLRQMLGELAQA